MLRGGNDPAIVLDDVNIDEVAPKVSLQELLGR
jgi:acyl-CoA reductase-like NAD-dependent aldehyde dehydrogenase